MSLTLRKMNKGLPGKGASLGFATWALTAVTLASVGLLTFAVTPGDRSEDVYADDVEAEARVNVAPAASIALEYYDPSSSTYVDSDKLRLTIDPDNFKTGAMRITTSTNSPEGMKLSMNDSDSNNALVEQGDSQSSPAKPYISSITANKTIADVTDSGKAFSDNTWGYAVADTTVGSSAAPEVPLTYSQIPTAETLLDETDELGDSAYIFTAGVRVGRTLPAGIYKDQLTFTVIANPLPEPAPESFYGMNGKYMQASYVPTLCSAATTPSASATALDSTGDHAGDTNYVPSITMKDQRDEQEYAIRKLADGNCWMTENLRYGINPDGSTHPWVSGDAALTDTNDADTLNNIQIETAESSGTVWQNSYEAPYIAITGANDTDANTGTKWGALYNYCAASGGTNCNPESGPKADATGSICPKGWTMPSFATKSTGTPSSSDVDKSYQKLLNNYGVSDYGVPGVLLTSPVSFPLSGNFGGGSLINRGGYGFFWSSSAVSVSYSFNLALYSGGAGQDFSNRSSGYSVRCLASS